MTPNMIWFRESPVKPQETFNSATGVFRILNFNFSAVSFILGVFFGFYLGMRRTKLPRKSVHCLLFSPNQIKWGFCSCNSNYFCQNSTCPLCNYKVMLSVVRNAKFYVDVCVYLITNNEITELLISLKCKGVKIRIITDKEMSSQGKEVQINKFKTHFIPVKVNDEFSMHNKFVIIDGMVLITGSLNWTRQGFTRNFENAVAIFDADIIKRYKSYYDELWLTSSETVEF